MRRLQQPVGLTPRVMQPKHRGGAAQRSREEQRGAQRSRPSGFPPACFQLLSIAALLLLRRLDFMRPDGPDWPRREQMCSLVLVLSALQSLR